MTQTQAQPDARVEAGMNAELDAGTVAGAEARRSQDHHGTRTVFASINSRGTMSLPASIRRRFRLNEPGAQVEITTKEGSDVIELRPHLPIPVDQLWYWTPEWQAGEREAEEQIANGDTMFFEDGEALLNWLADNR
ncbi:MAG: AbrB/MazE/SpoVT family DNA-binding domain-containing protein [Bifidobacteriaceae bacterium]|jgi:bifunctional DNA-binding transcriptional regulator/antitoxin component of YhaV-PrlF toxin-antitoxin module|nr:AbrB/MazE/SpoVT family DNA-binding domain-containing protein [Bifidobacteriaceae bacterium]